MGLRYKRNYRSRSRYGSRKYVTRKFISKKRRYNYNQSRNLRRRPLPPEIKFADTQFINSTLPAGSNTNGTCSISTMLPGNVEATRIGECIKSRYVKITLNFEGPQANTTSNPVYYSDCKMRVVFYTPRVNATEANAYMGGIGNFDMIDFNQVSVLCDQYITVGANLINVSGTAANGNGIKSQIIMRKSLKFVRNMRFNKSNNNLNVDKDIIYYCILNCAVAGSNFYVTTTGQSRLTYVDN